MKITRPLGSFQAKSDSGQVYTVFESQEFHSVLSGSGTIVETEGVKKWKLSTGSPVNQIDALTYKIVATDEVIRKF